MALSDDGREIRLNPDGTWEYESQDRYATLPSGERIRLKADGRWETVAADSAWAAPLVSATTAAGRQDISRVSSQLTLVLGDFVIETVRSTQHKNTRVKSQMLIEIRSEGTVSGSPSIEPQSISLQDSRGRSYEILAIAWRDNVLMIRADDAPRWWGVKYFQLTLPGGAFGSAGDIQLVKNMSEVVREEVESLSTL
ncbi:MAG: hypothetical protein O3B72_09935 [Proteobacteria bacterium]|nr:hypothetical protein [Pseudomonadota bacterium]